MFSKEFFAGIHWISFVSGTVKNVTSEGYDLGGTVEFESSESEEGIEKCQFDYLVIATGAQYGTPIKDGNRTKANRSQGLPFSSFLKYLRSFYFFKTSLVI